MMKAEVIDQYRFLQRRTIRKQGGVFCPKVRTYNHKLKNKYSYSYISFDACKECPHHKGIESVMESLNGDVAEREYVICETDIRWGWKMSEKTGSEGGKDVRCKYCDCLLIFDEQLKQYWCNTCRIYSETIHLK